MSSPLHFVVCASIVPDPLQTLEPVTGSGLPALKNETMLPAVLDPWAAHSLYESAALAKAIAGSRLTLVSLGPKVKLQQVMMTVGQKVPFEFVAVDGSASGFTESAETAAALVEAIKALPNLDLSRLVLSGGWESASRGAGTTLQIVGEMLGIRDQFQGVDEVKVEADGSLRILERLEGGKYQVSVCSGPPVVLGWATGTLPEPPNNPQVGMMNMRGVMPALQRAKAATVGAQGVRFVSAELPRQKRDTRIVKDASADEIAREIVEWIRGH
jgi:electron transfer flavoprotein beta subunit